MIKLSSAKRYAKTLFEMAQEKGLVEKFSADLSALREVCEKAEAFVPFLGNPTYDFALRKEAFSEIAKNMGLHQFITNLVFLLMDGNKVRLLPYICRYFHDVEDVQAGRVRATIRVPAALDTAEFDGIRKALEKAMGKTVIIGTEQDASMIGGLWIKVGDIVYDGTIRRQLEILKDNLIKG